jgi:hypothetical protein
LEEIIILHGFREHQEASHCTCFSYSRIPISFTCEDFKLIACSVQELWCSQVETNCDAAAAVHSSSRTLVIQGSDVKIIIFCPISIKLLFDHEISALYAPFFLVPIFATMVVVALL